MSEEALSESDLEPSLNSEEEYLENEDYSQNAIGIVRMRPV